MTRKDFQLIADVLAKTNAPADVILSMAAALAGTNRLFDRQKFLAACGYSGSEFDRGFFG